MNHTIVKLRTRKRGNKYRKLFSDKELYIMPDDLGDGVAFTPDHNLDEEDWFVVTDFSRQEYCIPLLQEPFVSTAYEMLEKEQFGDIDYLCYVDEGKYFFQRVSKASLVTKRKVIFGDVAEYKEECKEIVIHKNADAIYIKEKDVLYFKNLSAIAGIFIGIDILYREATEDETKAFLENDFIELENFSSDDVKKANRKRIAMVSDLMKTMKKKRRKIIFDSIKEYCPQLVTDKGQFKIATEHDLKLVLYGIDQRFYTTPDGEEKRIANSIIRLE